MKRKMVILAVAIAIVAAAVSAGWAGKVLFEDKFATLDPAWGFPDETLNVKDGKLVVTLKPNESWTFLNQANVFPNDMDISCTVKWLKAPSIHSAGLVFWAKDQNEYYCVLFSSNGQLAVYRLIANRFLQPVAWRPVEAIKQGEGAENQIKVVTKGNQATISMNGKEVISIKGQPPRGAASSG